MASGSGGKIGREKTVQKNRAATRWHLFSGGVCAMAMAKHDPALSLLSIHTGLGLAISLVDQAEEKGITCDVSADELERMGGKAHKDRTKRYSLKRQLQYQRSDLEAFGEFISTKKQKGLKPPVPSDWQVLRRDRS